MLVNFILDDNLFCIRGFISLFVCINWEQLRKVVNHHIISTIHIELGFVSESNESLGKNLTHTVLGLSLIHI